MGLENGVGCDGSRQWQAGIRCRHFPTQNRSYARINNKKKDGAEDAPSSAGILPAHVKQVTAVSQCRGINHCLRPFHRAVEVAINGRHGQGNGCRFRNPGRRINVVFTCRNVLGGFGAILVIVAGVIEHGRERHRFACLHNDAAHRHIQRLRPGRGQIRLTHRLSRINERRHIAGNNVIFKETTALEKRGAQFKSISGQPHFTIGKIVGRAVGWIQANRLFGVIAVEVGKLAPQRLHGRAVGRGRGRKTPGPQHQFAVAVNVHINAGGSDWRSGVQGGVSEVGVVGEDVILYGLRLRFRSGGGATIGLITLAAAGATAAAPFKLEVTVQVSAPIGGGGAAIVLVGVFAPGEAGFGLFTAVRVCVQHQMNLVIVHQPGGVGIHAIVVDQVLGKAGHQFGGGIFAGMNGRRNK